LFVCCAFVLLRALLGVGHNAESCGVYAHEATDLRPGGSVPGSPDVGPDANDPKFHTKNEMLPDRGSRDEQAHVRLERAEELYGYQYDWKMGEYEIEHDDDGDDRYDDEYEREDFSDPTP